MSLISSRFDSKSSLKGSIWYHHSESLEVLYSPNQFIGLDFFCHFLQQTGSNDSHGESSQLSWAVMCKNKSSSSEYLSSHCETITHILTTVLPGGPELSHMYLLGSRTLRKFSIFKNWHVNENLVFLKKK